MGRFKEKDGTYLRRGMGKIKKVGWDKLKEKDWIYWKRGMGQI